MRITTLLLSLATTAAAAQSILIERPLYLTFKDKPEPQVRGYVLFGTLPNGKPAITKNSKGHAFFVERTLLTVNQETGFHIAAGIDCKTGTHWGIAGGSLEKMQATTEEKRISVKDVHPQNLPTYRKICDEVDLQRGKW